MPIEQLLSDIQQAVECLQQDAVAPHSLLADPERLLRVLVDGEQRRLAGRRRYDIPVPRFCIFSVTWRCNLDCVGCYAKGYARRGDLPLETLEAILADACGLGSYLFVIVGGEPLLVEGLIDALARRRDAVFFVFTNATMMTDKHVEAFEAAGNILPVISLEGDNTLTDQRRGEGVGRSVQRGMAMLRERAVPFGFASMVTHRNLARVTSREWFDDVWAGGARFGYLIDYVPLPLGLDESLVLTGEDMALKKDLVAQRYSEARPLVINFPPDEYEQGACQAAGRGFIHINADGLVEPCPFSHFAADSIVDKPLHDVLASPFMCGLRDAMTGWDNPSGECLLFAHQTDVCTIARQTGAVCTDADPAQLANS